LQDGVSELRLYGASRGMIPTGGGAGPGYRSKIDQSSLQCAPPASSTDSNSIHKTATLRDDDGTRCRKRGQIKAHSLWQFGSNTPGLAA